MKPIFYGIKNIKDELYSSIYCVCVYMYMCVCVYMGKFIKTNQKIIVPKHGYIFQKHQKKKSLNNIIKFLLLNLT